MKTSVIKFSLGVVLVFVFLGPVHAQTYEPYYQSYGYKQDQILRQQQETWQRQETQRRQQQQAADAQRQRESAEQFRQQQERTRKMMDDTAAQHQQQTMQMIKASQDAVQRQRDALESTQKIQSQTIMGMQQSAVTSPDPGSTPQQTISDEKDRATQEIVTATAGEIFEIRFTANHSTGYSWKLIEPLDGKRIKFIKSEYLEGENKFMDDGEEVWTFQALAAGETKISVQYVSHLSASNPKKLKKIFSVNVAEAVVKAVTGDLTPQAKVLMSR